MDELQYAWFQVVLDRDPHRPLPDVAADALVAGEDTPALRELAGLDRNERRDARELLALTMEEMGLQLPSAHATAWERVRGLLDPDAVAALEAALALVQKDLDATLPRIGRVSLYPLSIRQVLVQMPNGDYCNHGGWTFIGGDQRTAIRSVAATAQECIVELERVEWPLCPRHDRMLDVAADKPVWVCRVDGCHQVALIGQVGAVGT